MVVLSTLSAMERKGLLTNEKLWSIQICFAQANTTVKQERRDKKNKTPYCFISTSLLPAPKCRQSTLHLT